LTLPHPSSSQWSLAKLVVFQVFRSQSSSESSREKEIMISNYLNNRDLTSLMPTRVIFSLKKTVNMKKLIVFTPTPILTSTKNQKNNLIILSSCFNSTFPLSTRASKFSFGNHATPSYLRISTPLIIGSLAKIIVSPSQVELLQQNCFASEIESDEIDIS
jgi:hypothetical protein